ncbi:hypothetical protein SCM14_13210, partial [Legionella pneumophila serogroup 1]
KAKPLLGRSLRKTVVKISNFKATGLLRRYAPRNDGPKNRTVQSLNSIHYCSLKNCNASRVYFINTGRKLLIKGISWFSWDF